MGIGGFLAGWKTDISSAGLLLEGGSGEGWRACACVVGRRGFGGLEGCWACSQTGPGSLVSAAALPFGLFVALHCSQRPAAGAATQQRLSR